MSKIMTLAELQQLACDFGLKACAALTSQTELIRAIQALRGEEPCFSTDKLYNCTEVCEWRQNCRKLMAVWLR